LNLLAFHAAHPRGNYRIADDGTKMNCIELVADIASIITALAAVTASLYYWCHNRKQRILLESYLKSERAAHPGKPQRTALHLVARIGLTSDEILRASFSSRHVKRSIHVDSATNLADEVLFEYQD
jgi:hypothetical protein